MKPILNGVHELRLVNITEECTKLYFNNAWNKGLQELYIHFMPHSETVTMFKGSKIKIETKDMTRMINFDCLNLQKFKLFHADIPNIYISNINSSNLRELVLYETRINIKTVQMIEEFVNLRSLNLYHIQMDESEVECIKTYIQQQINNNNNKQINNIFSNLDDVSISHLAMKHDAIEWISYYILANGNKQKNLLFCNEFQGWSKIGEYPKPLFFETDDNYLRKLQIKSLQHINKIELRSQFNTIDKMISFISKCIEEEDDEQIDNIEFDVIDIRIKTKEDDIKINRNDFISPNISTKWDTFIEFTRESTINFTLQIEEFEEESDFFKRWAVMFTEEITEENDENDDIKEDDDVYTSFIEYHITLDCGYPITSLFGDYYLNKKDYNECIDIFIEQLFKYYLSEWFNINDIEFEQLTTQFITINILINLDDWSIENIADTLLLHDDIRCNVIHQLLPKQWKDRNFANLVINRLQQIFDKKYPNNTWTIQHVGNNNIEFFYFPPIFTERS